MRFISQLLLLGSIFIAAGASARETVRVAIGTQDTTINCAAGGPLVRELHLLEKYLPHTGKYANVEYDIRWENQPTGAQLNSKYLANQLDIVMMADFPSVIGATALEASGGGVHSYYIANLSGGIRGAGNAILVPSDSPVTSLSELKGKKISVPFGSTAHAMLIRAIQDLGWDPNSDVQIVASPWFGNEYGLTLTTKADADGRFGHVDGYPGAALPAPVLPNVRLQPRN